MNIQAQRTEPRSTATADAVSAGTRSARSGGRFQISLTLMLLLMVVFAFISAGLFYAMRVPAIRQEVSLLFGIESNDGAEDVGRFAQLAFIMFTFTSPLLLAAVLSLIVSFSQALQRKTR